MQWSQWSLDTLSQDLPPEAHSLLGPNEPNHHLQADLTPEVAARLWPALQKAADEHSLRLGSPAASPCGADCVLADPFEWLDRFFKACVGCRIDFIASHYYSCSAPYLALYVAELARYGRPVWLTELACPLGPSAGGEATQAAYMAAALDVLDKEPVVERYAWFAPRTYDCDWIGPGASLLQAGQPALTQLGALYIGAPGGQGPPPQATQSDQGAGLGALQADERGPFIRMCTQECGYWNYGTGLGSPRAGKPGRLGSE
ncbi:hypothetical protein WJX81_004434 [Elliptochloris bilobata]|uniref:Asl1-like glycosyl hydrolase catalytic domain-containing protein n=1 Tax=Elliptochloris bilobata TaxID=381761 RepID=A0AAW1QZY1_9CHLO